MANGWLLFNSIAVLYVWQNKIIQKKKIKCKQGMGTEADNILANGFIRALHMFVKEVFAFFFSTSQLLIVIKLGQAR